MPNSFTKFDFAMLEDLIDKLDRNRHFIENGFFIGLECIHFREVLQKNKSKILSNNDDFVEKK